MTPYTEVIHARPGGGVDVYNQSQMHGGAIPAMAGGGTLKPAGGNTYQFNITKADADTDETVLLRTLNKAHFLAGGGVLQQ